MPTPAMDIFFKLLMLSRIIEPFEFSIRPRGLDSIAKHPAATYTVLVYSRSPTVATELGGVGSAIDVDVDLVRLSTCSCLSCNQSIISAHL